MLNMHYMLIRITSKDNILSKIYRQHEDNYFALQQTHLTTEHFLALTLCSPSSNTFAVSPFNLTFLPAGLLVSNLKALHA